MNSKDAIAKIRAILGMAPAAIRMSTAKLKDGTEISYDKLETGGIVTLGDAPAASGDYELEDGTVLTVGEDGAITNIVAPAEDTPVEDSAAEAHAEEAPAEEEPAEQPDNTESRLAAVEQQVAALTLAFEELINSLSEMSTEMSAQRAVIDEIAAQPAGEPAHFSAASTKLKTEETVFEKRLRGLDQLKKMKQ